MPPHRWVSVATAKRTFDTLLPRNTRRSPPAALAGWPDQRLAGSVTSMARPQLADSSSGSRKHLDRLLDRTARADLVTY